MNHSNKNSYDVAVIGGGAAGLVAAITASRSGAKTIVIEHMDRVGKKILSTGNGKCNYTNALQGIAYYRGENPAFVLPVFEQFGLEDTLRFFSELGIYPKEKRGYYYPASEQAASVLDVLRMELSYRDVSLQTSFELTGIEKQSKSGREPQFELTGHSAEDEKNRQKIYAKTILFATGLLAAPKTGSDGSAFSLIRKFNHHFIDVVPALVPLQGKQTFFKALAGIRTEMELRLYIEKECAAVEQGELQLTDYGISGIPVFQVSRFATRALSKKQAVSAEIDFLPKLTAEEVLSLLKERFLSFGYGKSTSEAMIGLFPRKLNDVLLKESGVRLDIPAEQLSYRQLSTLCAKIKAFRVDICGSKPIELGQVCAGGVNTCEIDNETLESKLVSGIYFAGEVIDIDGTCGGYNLQWAWSSGYVAGIHAAAKTKRSRT